jgi:hypothetical protein
MARIMYGCALCCKAILGGDLATSDGHYPDSEEMTRSRIRTMDPMRTVQKLGFPS